MAKLNFSPTNKLVQSTHVPDKGIFCARGEQISLQTPSTSWHLDSFSLSFSFFLPNLITASYTQKERVKTSD